MSELVTLINAAADHAYQEIGAGYHIAPANMPRSRTCRMTTLAMKWYLEDQGVTDVMTEVRSTVLTREHYYLTMRDAGQLVLADPTWQQFLTRKADEGLPNVLFGTREEAIAFAEKAGVHQLDLKLWTPVDVPQQAIDDHPANGHQIIAKTS